MYDWKNFIVSLMSSLFDHRTSVKVSGAKKGSRSF